jgi:hypothetical protein
MAAPARAIWLRRCSAMVAVGVIIHAPGESRKRWSATRDFPDAGGPVIRRESGK